MDNRDDSAARRLAEKVKGMGKDDRNRFIELCMTPRISPPPQRTKESTNTALAAAEARIAELEADNEHLLTVNAGLQKKLEGLIPALRDCVYALKLACRERTPAARRAAALLKEKE